MAFSDWEFYLDSNTDASPELSSPIDGLQSLNLSKIDSPANLNRDALAIPTVASGLTLGVTAGRMRTLFSLSDVSQANHGAFISCMHSIKSLSSSCYYLLIKGSGDAIIKKSGGTIGSGGTVLAGPTNVATLVNDTVYAMELMWFYDVPEFSGIKLEAKFGTMTDFSDLSLISGLSIIDSVSPYSTSVAEGVGLSDQGATQLQTVLFEKTTLYTVAFI